MKNQMNELVLKVSKYDFIIGFFISLVILYFLSFYHAIVYLLGVIIAIINFIASTYANKKWFINNNFLLIISTFCRIILVSIAIIPFIGQVTLVATYVAGFTSHFVNLSYCTISKKGSA